MSEIEKPPVLAARGGASFRAGGLELHLGAEDDFQPARKGHPGILVNDLDEVARRLGEAAQDVTWDGYCPHPNIADITAFSVRKTTRQDKKNGASMLQQVFVLQGSGTELAACAVNYGTAERIEAWIRSHLSFRGNVPQYGLPPSTPAAPHR